VNDPAMPYRSLRVLQYYNLDHIMIVIEWCVVSGVQGAEWNPGWEQLDGDIIGCFYECFKTS